MPPKPIGHFVDKTGLPPLGHKTRPAPEAPAAAPPAPAASVAEAPPRVIYVEVERPAKVQPIEKTGKQWKGAMLAFLLVLIAGIVLLLSAGPTRPYDFGTQRVLGVLTIVIGFLGYILARVGAWWNHG